MRYYPICNNCKVRAIKHHEYIAGNGRAVYWICPICLNTDQIWDCGQLTEEELDGNLRFLAFMHGIDFDCIKLEVWD